MKTFSAGYGERMLSQIDEILSKNIFLLEDHHFAQSNENIFLLGDHHFAHSNKHIFLSRDHKFAHLNKHIFLSRDHKFAHLNKHIFLSGYTSQDDFPRFLLVMIAILW